MKSETDLKENKKKKIISYYWFWFSETLQFSIFICMEFYCTMNQRPNTEEVYECLLCYIKMVVWVSSCKKIDILLWLQEDAKRKGERPIQYLPSVFPYCASLWAVRSSKTHVSSDFMRLPLVYMKKWQTFFFPPLYFNFYRNGNNRVVKTLIHSISIQFFFLSILTLICWIEIFSLEKFFLPFFFISLLIVSSLECVPKTIEINYFSH